MPRTKARKARDKAKRLDKSHGPKECCCCGGKVELKSHKEIYGRTYNAWPWMYFCLDCEARVGVHPGTYIPLGSLANDEIRKARMAAHKAFDPMWKSKNMARREAYHWLADKLGISPGSCHISWMGTKDCEKIVAVCKT